MGKEFYTKAEFEAMMREEERAEREAEREASNPTPETPDEFKETLALVSCTIGGVEVNTVPSSNLHEALDIETPNRKWFNRIVERFGFVEGEDYVPLSYDMNTVEGRQAIGRNRGNPVYDYQMTVDMAKEICMVQATPLGRRVRQYFLIAERVAKQYAAEQFKKALVDASNNLKHQTQIALKNEQALLTASKKLGFKNITQMEQELQTQQRAERKETSLRLETAKALMLQRGVGRMKNAGWDKAKCEAVYGIIELELERAEREEDCSADPF